MNIPSEAKVVVIGAGVIGCSVAYQLTKAGVKDVVVLDRKRISSGTSWHAAGILAELRASESMIYMAKETTGMFEQLEKETGYNIKFKRTGSLFVTANNDRRDQFRMMLSTAKSYGVEAYEVSVSEAKQKWPLVREDDLVGSIFVPNDALICPQRGTEALAKGVEMGGGKIFENVKVTKILSKDGRANGVETDNGTISAEYVVMTTGIWSKEIGDSIGLNIPLQPMEHYYLLTGKIDGLDPMLPLLRDFDARSYVRPTLGTRWHEEEGHLMLGFFEKNGKPWGMDGIPEDFEFGNTGEDWSHMESVLNLVRHRIPATKEVNIETFFSGPESFTYDNNYIMGEAPLMKNLMVATGFNSRGIQSCGGAGRYIAEWITEKKEPTRYDNHDISASRCPKHTANKKFLHDRSKEILGLLYDINYPYLQIESARPIRMSPLHERLADLGACFGETAGWERPNWYAPSGVKPKYEYSFHRQNWFEHSAQEHMQVREGVAFFDQTSFGKLLVQGNDALKLLDLVSCSRVDVKIGKVVYTQFLNESGGVESDLTIIRTSEKEFLIYTSAPSQQRDYNYLYNKINLWNLNATVSDVTSGFSVISLMGPKSRELMQKMSGDDFSHEGFPFGTSRIIDFGYARARATRLTFVGELGWEVSIPTEFTLSCFDMLMKEGQSLGLAPAGYHALNSLRLEKGYVHWGHDVCPADTPVETGLGFIVHLKKEADFLGRKILEEQKLHGVSKRLVAFKLLDTEPLLYHFEPIFRNGKKVGKITSGMYSPVLGCSIGLGQITNDDGIVDEDFIVNAKYEIKVMNSNYAAQPSMKAWYDPSREKIIC